MNKPFLIVVSGRPASGKSTLSHILSKEFKCPLISRDELKEGFVNTLGVQHEQLDNSATLHIYHTFFEVINLLISKNISLIVEAAFQDRLWKPELLSLQDKAEIRIINCEIQPELARERFKTRLLNNPDRDRFHGDNMARDNGGLQADFFERINMDVPILVVDTTNNYVPDISQIIAFIKQEAR